MRTISGALTSALAAGHAVLVTLVRIQFPSGDVALNSSNWDLVYDGVTYRGAYGLGSISPVEDKSGELPGIQLEMQRIDSAAVALALDEADEVQGSVVTIRTAFLDTTTYQIVAAEIDWIGYADTMTLSEDGASGTVGLTAESKGVDLLRGSPLLYSDADQQSLVPGDRAFEYIASQTDQPVVWPSRDWFTKR